MAICNNIVYGPSADDANPDTTTNAIIPSNGKPKIRIQAIYADDGISIAYYEHTLSIETVIYSETAINPDIEAEAARLRVILMTPGLRLRLIPLGLSNFPIINGPDANQAIANGKKDVKGGPYPQECIIEPIASTNAILVVWVVMFRIKYCASELMDLIQYNAEVDIDVDDEGDVTFNYRVSYQQRVPISTIATLTPLVNALVRNGNQSFNGMKRRKRTSFSRDMRYVQIHIEYKDIKSDSAYFPQTRNIDLTDRISSDLLGGNSVGSATAFYTWARKIEATITLPQRLHKSYAWTVFLKAIQEKFTHLRGLGKIAPLMGMSGSGGESDTKNWFILTKIVVINPVYTRTMRFELEYLVCTDLGNMLSKTKVFSRINTRHDNDNNPLPLSQQWTIWDSTSDINVNGGYKYEVTGIPIVYTQCSSNAPPTPHVAATVEFLDEIEDTNPDTIYEKPYRGIVYPLGEGALNTEFTWLHYQNTPTIYEKTNNSLVSYLQPTPASDYYKTSAAEARTSSNRTSLSLQLNGKYGSQVGESLPPKVINRGTSTFYIRMRGMAVRVNGRIPAPVLVSVAGKPAIRTGLGSVLEEQIGKGDVPIYMCKWDQLYAIEGDIYAEDILSSMVTSGEPANYT